MTVDNCPANEPAKPILMLKTVLLGPFRADVIGGRYRGLRPRLLTSAPSAPINLKGGDEVAMFDQNHRNRHFAN